jgi:hypothetical protein
MPERGYPTSEPWRRVVLRHEAWLRLARLRSPDTSGASLAHRQMAASVAAGRDAAVLLVG